MKLTDPDSQSIHFPENYSLLYSAEENMEIDKVVPVPSLGRAGRLQQVENYLTRARGPTYWLSGMNLMCVKNVSRRLFLTALVLQAAVLSFTKPARGQVDTNYTSPFIITNLSTNISSWTSDFANRTAAINTNSASWYSTAYGNSSYGPTNPQLYSVGSLSGAGAAAATALQYDRGGPAFNTVLNTPTGGDADTWARQRLIYAAQQLIGTPYQHLHLPTFNPASVTNGTFPWKEVSSNTYLQTTQQLDDNIPNSGVINSYSTNYGKPEAGIDCTDFAAYIYNLALGIQMHSGTGNQISFINDGATNSTLATNSIPTSTLVDSTGNVLTPTFLKSTNFGTSTLNAPGSLEPITSQLQPGDLLYMHGEGAILHVVVWLGRYGTNIDGSATNVDLVISSHDNTPAIFDTQNINPTTGYPLSGTNTLITNLPPPGVQILPFTPENWFYQNFSVAMQIPVPEPSASALLLLVGYGLTGVLFWRGSRRRNP